MGRRAQGTGFANRSFSEGLAQCSEFRAQALQTEAIEEVWLRAQSEYPPRQKTKSRRMTACGSSGVRTRPKIKDSGSNRNNQGFRVIADCDIISSE